MMCTTVLNGGVCHCTSTPHKSRNEMKEKKKFTFFQNEVCLRVIYYLIIMLVHFSSKTMSPESSQTGSIFPGLFAIIFSKHFCHF